MKTIKNLIVTLGAGLLLCCCSDGNDLMIDGDFEEKLSRGDEAAFWRIEQVDYYNRETVESPWKKFDDSGWGGLGHVSPNAFFIRDGLCFVEMNYITSSGPEPIVTLLKAYNKKVGKSHSIYFYSSFDALKNTTGTSLFGMAKVLELNRSYLKWEIIHSIWVADNISLPLMKEVVTYKAVAPEDVDMGKMLLYENRDEAYRDVIAKCKELFGNEISMKWLYGASVDFDDYLYIHDNVLYIDEFERMTGY